MSVWTILQIIVVIVVFPAFLFIAYLTEMSNEAAEVGFGLCMLAIIFLGIADTKRAG